MVGFSTKRRPWSNWLIAANLVVSLFSTYFKAILRESWFCISGGVFNKTKTLIRLVDSRKCFRFPVSASIENHVGAILMRFQSDFEGVFGVRFVPTR